MQSLVRQPILIVIGLYYVLVSCLSPNWFRPADSVFYSVGWAANVGVESVPLVTSCVVEINVRKTSNRFFGLPVFSGSVLSNLHGCFYILRLLFFPGLVLKPFSLSLVALFCSCLLQPAEPFFTVMLFFQSSIP